MNPCIKTGAHVYLAPYGEYAYGDAFLMGGVYLFRIVARSRDPIFPYRHFTVHSAEATSYLSFKDGNVETILALEVTSHSYYGETIPEVIS